MVIYTKKKKTTNNRLIMNALILLGVAVFLGARFTLTGGWGAAQVVIMLILAVTAGVQLFVHFKFFRE